MRPTSLGFAIAVILCLCVVAIPGLVLSGCATTTTTTDPNGTVTVVESRIDVAAVAEIIRLGGAMAPQVLDLYLEYEAVRQAQNVHDRLDELAVLQAKIEAAIALWREAQDAIGPASKLTPGPGDWELDYGSWRTCEGEGEPLVVSTTSPDPEVGE